MHRVPPVALILCLLLPFASTAHAEPSTSTSTRAEPVRVDVDAVLPPIVPWDGASRALALRPTSDHRWITPSERTAFHTTPSYDETVAWLRRLTAAAPELSMVSIGTSGEGRELWMVVASVDGDLTPGAMARRGKPIVLVQGGIHSGEIDGKDAGLMLLRDLTVGGAAGTKRELLERVQLLFVPILNVDGHERRSPSSRMNQRGPERPGWRTNARNHNLNRDYAKLDTPEVRAIVRVLERWKPDLYVDVHVTDGIDYEYDVTWGGSGEQALSPATARWLEATLRPEVSAELERMGHVPGDLVFSVDGLNPDRGLFHWSASSPRYSDGYGAARHTPTILVENHSLDPYDRRVLGTYVFLEGVLELVGRRGMELRQAIQADRALRPDPITLAWTVDRENPETVEFRGVTWSKERSEISGAERVVWEGEPERVTLPRVAPTVPAVQVARPKAYWVPAPWTDVIDRLERHGIRFETLAAAKELELELDRVPGASLADAPFEGRVRVELHEPPTPIRRTVVMPPGSIRVPTDQPLGDLAILLLEPQSPDSFFQWGFFLEILQRTEYFEPYVMEPTAEAMLEASPELRKQFEAALEDDDFAADPRARLEWFYERSPFRDESWRVYPVGRER